MTATTGHIRLSALNECIKQAISGAFSGLNFWVIADVTNHTFRQAKNYHHFERLLHHTAGNLCLD